MSALDLLPGRVRAAMQAAAEIGALPSAAHRPWPLPDEPWIMAQTWNDLLFAHWPVAPSTMRPLVPPDLVLDTFDGDAWVGITPFVLSGLRLRTAPAVPGVSTFPELNVRTYVRTGGKPGVFFWSLDAGSRLAVVAARGLYSLPYFRAAFAVIERDGWIDYTCRRTDAAGAPAEWQARYRASGPVARAPEGSLAAWLTERYCLYAVDRARQLSRAEIHHVPWPLQAAEVELRHRTMTQGLGFTLSGPPPLAHFAKRLDVHVWAPHPVER